MNITKGTVARAQKVAAYGPEGVGKTTWASNLPNPLFVDAEGGTDHIDVSRQVVKTVEEIREVCLYLIREEHDFQTAVFDTADWIEKQIVAEMLKDSGLDSIEDYGYGKGYKILEERFMALLELFDRVRNAGIHIVLLAHAKVMKFEEPDKGGSYDRYELKLEKKTAPLIKEWCDDLLFINYVTRVVEKSKGSEQKRGIGGKERIIHTERHAAYDAKNRHGLPETIKVDAERMPKELECVFIDVPKPGCAKVEPKEIVPTVNFSDVVKDCGGEEFVEAFLKGRGKTLATLDEEYKSRVIGNPKAFIDQVKAAIPSV